MLPTHAPERHGPCECEALGGKDCCISCTARRACSQCRLFAELTRWPGGDEPKPASTVDHAASGVEVIDAIEAWGLGFHLGNVVKYVARAGHKGQALDDLRKAAWYLNRCIAQLEEARA